MKLAADAFIYFIRWVLLVVSVFALFLTATTAVRKQLNPSAVPDEEMFAILAISVLLFAAWWVTAEYWT